MEFIEIIVAIGIVIHLGIFVLEKFGVLKKDPKYEEEKQDAKSSDNLSYGTKELFLETLTNIGCQYQIAEDDENRVLFDYQGEHFVADTFKESKLINLWDLYWEHVELYDIDDVSRIRKAINTANLNTSVTTIYVIDEDGKNLDVHTKTMFLFMSSMPDLETYLRIILATFFEAHKIVNTEMHKMRKQEQI